MSWQTLLNRVPMQLRAVNHYTRIARNTKSAKITRCVLLNCLNIVRDNCFSLFVFYLFLVITIMLFEMPEEESNVSAYWVQINLWNLTQITQIKVFIGLSPSHVINFNTGPWHFWQQSCQLMTLQMTVRYQWGLSDIFKLKWQDGGWNFIFIIFTFIMALIR